MLSTRRQVRDADDLLKDIEILRSTLDRVNSENRLLKHKLDGEKKEHRKALSKIKKLQSELTKERMK